LSHVAGRLAGWLLLQWFRTVRIEVIETVPGTSPFRLSGPRPYLFSVWHEDLLLGTFGRRSPCGAALISRHRDGEFLAGAVEVAGLETVRGSSRRGGAEATRQAIEVARRRHIAITPDGPLGPRRKTKTGIVYLASRTGNAIVPTATSYSRPWRVRGSWTDLLVPRPCSKAWLVLGTPIEVPPGLRRDGLEHHAELVTEAMHRAGEVASGLAAGQRATPPPRREAA